MEADIGDLLVESGILTPSDLDRARRVQAENGQRLSSLLVSLGMIEEGLLAETLANNLGLDIAAGDAYQPVPIAEGLASPDFLRQVQAIPLAEQGDAVVVAIANPLDQYALDALKLALGRDVIVQVGRMSEIEASIDRQYRDGASSMAQITREIDQELPQGKDDIQHLRDLASEAPIIRVVNLLISQALSAGASDIHIEPFRSELKIRFRIDGTLRFQEAPPASSADAIVSRIKVMAQLDIAERRLPQDGRIFMRFEGREVDIRISVMPTEYGESVVLRILDQENVPLDFRTLGFTGQSLQAFESLLEEPKGIVLATGPTGSGKTTTLYAALQKLNAPEVKILTVEDPVEYQMEGVNQVHVRPDIGLGFAEALRSFLRQDPDIIMVGEMRDLETARIAVQSALTGHQVFSTLHTNDAASSITRLLDMGIEDYLVSSVVNGIVAQRLVRTLCKHCAEPCEESDAIAEKLGLERLEPAEPIMLCRPVGCRECGSTGYSGRTGIVEVLTMTGRMGQALQENRDAIRLRAAALEDGMISMRDDGLRKAMRGETTVEEVDRVIRD